MSSGRVHSEEPLIDGGFYIFDSHNDTPVVNPFLTLHPVGLLNAADHESCVEVALTAPGMLRSRVMWNVSNHNENSQMLCKAAWTPLSAFPRGRILWGLRGNFVVRLHSLLSNRANLIVALAHAT